jgi:hypothetical protein
VCVCFRTNRAVRLKICLHARWSDRQFTDRISSNFGATSPVTWKSFALRKYPFKTIFGRLNDFVSQTTRRRRRTRPSRCSSSPPQTGSTSSSTWPPKRKWSGVNYFQPFLYYDRYFRRYLCYDHYFGVFVLWSPVPTFFYYGHYFRDFDKISAKMEILLNTYQETIFV